MIKACIFDLDGTIADTLESMAYVANEISRQIIPVITAVKARIC